MLGQAERPDKTRLCPSCRMEISVLATKCRYCGESVGRPRDEQRQLSIEDLGGETVVHYAPSSSVMEALESFRLEETVDSNPPEEAKGTQAGKKTFPSPAPTGAASLLPELDERSKALAEVAVPRSPTTVYRKKSRGPSLTQRIAWAAGIVVAVIVIVFIAAKVVAAIRESRKPVEPVVTVLPNPAKAILENNGPPLDALREAVTAFAKQDLPKNRAILEEARKRVVDAVNALLNADPFDHQRDLSKASELIEQALRIESSEQLRAVKAEVAADCQAYRGMLLRESQPDAQPPTASIAMTAPNGAEELVAVKNGDAFGPDQRFTVDRIGEKSVRLKDTKRPNRLITLGTDGSLHTQ